MATDELELDRDVRHAVYRAFSESGVAPSAPGLASVLGRAPAAVEASLERLAARRALVLRPGSHELWMAHPFSAVPTDYPVRAGGRTWWANCAWDAMGVAVLLGRDTVTETRCADCGEALRLEVREGRARCEGAVVHFVVPPRRFWDDIGFT